MRKRLAAEARAQAYDDAVNALYYEILSKTAPRNASLYVPPEEGRRTAEILPPIGIDTVGLIALSATDIIVGQPRALIQFIREQKEDSIDSVAEIVITDEESGRVARSRQFDIDYHVGSFVFRGLTSKNAPRKRHESSIKGQILGIHDVTSLYNYLDAAPVVEVPLFDLSELQELDEELAA